ncbi:MAG: hypothetical protein LBH25_10510 [Fibromonadaceae bacterium]|jgi:hypothetical protein|nr:hypothetical protein [Fibromonadaceae bacterium]
MKTYGSVTYEGQAYKTVVIGNQTWMAENLNFDATSSIPSDAEWQALVDFAGGDETAGTKLKSTSGWNTGSGCIPGTDDYGFSALPGGYGNSGGTFSNADNGGTVMCENHIPFPLSHFPKHLNMS